MFFRHHIIALLMLISTCAMAQTSPFLFHHLTEKDGLSNNIVSCFLRDRRGAFWIGTFDGLNRYDGSHFYSFKRTRDTSSLVNNLIHSLCEDRNGRIWGATNNGIFRYDPITNSFRNYAPVKSKVTPVNSNIARATNNIICDKNGDIWATGVWTILRFDPSGDKFEEIGPLTNDVDSLTAYSTRKNGLIEDPGGKGLWFATRRGLHFYEFATNRFISHKNSSSPLFAVRNVCALTRSRDGRCWFYDNNKEYIYKFDPASLSVYDSIDMSKELPGGAGATLFEDSDKRLWFSTWSTGVAVIDTRNREVTHIRNERDDPSSIINNFFWGVSEDEDGTIWLGTARGISKCNTSKSFYRIYRLSRDFEMLQNNSIRTIKEDPNDKSWWLVTRNKLFVIHFFPGSRKHKVYDLSKAVKNRKGALPGPVYSVQFDKNIPVLSTHTGIWQIDEAGDRVVPYVVKNAPAGYEPYEMVQSNGVFYFSNDSLLFKYDSRSNTTRLITHESVYLQDGQRAHIGSMRIAPNGQLWVGAAFGWLAYLDNNDKLKPVYLFRKDEEMGGYFTSMCVDNTGDIWLVNGGVGLYRYKPQTGQVRYWDDNDGLFSNMITTAVTDDNGRVWVVGENKFSIFTPTAESFNNFSLPLAENVVGYDNDIVRLSNGNIAVTVNNDIIEFFPGRLDMKPHILQPLIGAINIAGRDEFNVTGEKLHLNPDEKFLTIKFGLLTDEATFPYSFEYMLEGLDNKWTVAGRDHQAVYNKLPSGNYTFRLVAKAKNGTWQSPETRLNIHIKTPFFRSKLFYVSAILLVLLLLFLFYRFRTSKQRQLHALTSKAQLLEKEKALVMYESLKQQLNPHFLFNSLTSLGSLINVNPKVAGEFLESLGKTYRYILQSRDNEMVALIDEIRFAESYVKLQQTRFEKGLIVNISVDEEYYHRKIVPVTLQNMIENAIKHNIIDDESPLVIDIYVEEDKLVVKNNLQKKKFVETSNKHGLVHLQSLYRYLSSVPVEIQENEDSFTIKIPLL